MSTIDYEIKRIVTPIESIAATPPKVSASVRRRGCRTLRPGEVSLLTRYRHELTGNVLELGSRGDGLTDILCHHAYLFTGLAVSPLEATLCRSRYSQGSFFHGGLIELERFEDGAFDAIVAGPDAFERISKEHRTRVLAQISRVLAGGGILIFSAGDLEPLAQEKQLEQHAFALLESVNRFDEPVRSGESGLGGGGGAYFVARPASPTLVGWTLVDGVLV